MLALHVHDLCYRLFPLIFYIAVTVLNQMVTLKCFVHENTIQLRLKHTVVKVVLMCTYGNTIHSFLFNNHTHCVLAYDIEATM